MKDEKKEGEAPKLPQIRKSTAKRVPTPKQERFAKVYAATGNASEAYRQAYNTATMAKDTVHLKAYELSRHPTVQSLIATEKAAIAETIIRRSVITKDKISEMLLEAFQLAKRCEQAGAGVQAAMGLAKLYGMIIDKAENLNKSEHELTREQLETIAKQAIVSSPEPAESPPKPEESWEKSMKSAH